MLGTVLRQRKTNREIRLFSYFYISNKISSDTKLHNEIHK